MHRLIILYIFLALPVTVAPVWAEEPVPSSTESQASTRIEADPESQAIRFYIDDKLAAVLKDDGLYVRGDIVFGGTITDTGTGYFDQMFVEMDERAGDERAGEADAP